jgi:hypothetical protein
LRPATTGKWQAALALDLELHEGTVVADRVGETPCVFLAGLHRAERTIAERLTRESRTRASVSRDSHSMSIATASLAGNVCSSYDKDVYNGDIGF